MKEPFEASYKRAARMEKFGIQDCKYPSSPRKERTSFFVNGVGMFRNNDFSLYSDSFKFR